MEKIKHNYTNETELKSLLIRMKNSKFDNGSPERNRMIEKYIRWHSSKQSRKFDRDPRVRAFRNKLRDRIVALSEMTCADERTRERFGAIILLMIQNILRKPQFSNYNYTDDFYSDSIYKILKYLHNFNHTKISERTGLPYNAFSYISEIIHNSVIFIINMRKKELERHQIHVEFVTVDHGVSGYYDDWALNNSLVDVIDRRNLEGSEGIPEVKIEHIETTLTDALVEILQDFDGSSVRIIYPCGYRISEAEYDKIKDMLKPGVSIVRSVVDE